MSEKKTVSRNVVVALGVICTILVVLLAGSILLYTENISTLNFEKKVLQGNVNDLTVEKTALQIQVNGLTDVVNLANSTVWVDGGTVNLMDLSPTYEENASFAGYVSVQVSSQYNSTVEVGYFSHGVNYENSIIVGSSGTAVFPVLPSSSISIYIFQTLSEYFVLSGPLYATVTITYYY
jgi:hypothetical protein